MASFGGGGYGGGGGGYGGGGGGGGMGLSALTQEIESTLSNIGGMDAETAMQIRSLQQKLLDQQSQSRRQEQMMRAERENMMEEVAVRERMMQESIMRERLLEESMMRERMQSENSMRERRVQEEMRDRSVRSYDDFYSRPADHYSQRRDNRRDGDKRFQNVTSPGRGRNRDRQDPKPGMKRTNEQRNQSGSRSQSLDKGRGGKVAKTDQKGGAGKPQQPKAGSTQPKSGSGNASKAKEQPTAQKGDRLWNCKLCQKTITSTQLYFQHLCGGYHKRQKYLAKKAGNLPEKAGADKIVSDIPIGQQYLMEAFCCSLCGGVFASAESGLNMHCKSESHYWAVQKHKKREELDAKKDKDGVKENAGEQKSDESIADKEDKKTDGGEVAEEEKPVKTGEDEDELMLDIDDGEEKEVVMTTEEEEAMLGLEDEAVGEEEEADVEQVENEEEPTEETVEKEAVEEDIPEKEDEEPVEEVAEDVEAEKLVEEEEVEKVEEDVEAVAEAVPDIVEKKTPAKVVPSPVGEKKKPARGRGRGKKKKVPTATLR